MLRIFAGKFVARVVQHGSFCKGNEQLAPLLIGNFLVISLSLYHTCAVLPGELS